MVARPRCGPDAPAEPGAAADRDSSAGSTAPQVVSAAAELSRSAFAAPKAAGACGRFGRAFPKAAVTRLRHAAPRPAKPCRRGRPRSDTKRSRWDRAGAGGRAAVRSGSPRPNQALQRTAYHEAVLRPGRWFPPPLSWVVRPCGTGGRRRVRVARRRVPAAAVTRLRHAALKAREARRRERPQRGTKRRRWCWAGAVVVRRGVAGYAPAEPGAAPDRPHRLVSRHRCLPAAAELSRSAGGGRRGPVGRGQCASTRADGPQLLVRQGVRPGSARRRLPRCVPACASRRRFARDPPGHTSGFPSSSSAASGQRAVLPPAEPTAAAACGWPAALTVGRGQARLRPWQAAKPERLGGRE